VLAEIGDDRARFADARALKAYAGSAPITRASGRSLSVTHRHIKNNRLAAAGWIWAFAAATNSPAARQHYRRRRQHGDRHGAATRHLFNKLLGQLYHCCNANRGSTKPRHSHCRRAKLPHSWAFQLALFLAWLVGFCLVGRK
jgi:ferric-dicitrate binding protein FerR (iron transport regulator)